MDGSSTLSAQTMKAVRNSAVMPMFATQNIQVRSRAAGSTQASSHALSALATAGGVAMAAAPAAVPRELYNLPAHSSNLQPSPQPSLLRLPVAAAQPVMAPKGQPLRVAAPVGNIVTAAQPITKASPYHHPASSFLRDVGPSPHRSLSHSQHFNASAVAAGHATARPSYAGQQQQQQHQIGDVRKAMKRARHAACARASRRRQKANIESLRRSHDELSAKVKALEAEKDRLTQMLLDHETKRRAPQDDDLQRTKPKRQRTDSPPLTFGPPSPEPPSRALKYTPLTWLGKDADGGDDDRGMFFIWLSQHLLPAATAAAAAGIFDALSNRGPMALDAIALHCSVSLRAVEAIAPTLEALGLLRSAPGKPSPDNPTDDPLALPEPRRHHRYCVFRLTTRARRYLCSDSPFSWLRPLWSTTGNTSHARLLRVLKGKPGCWRGSGGEGAGGTGVGDGASAATGWEQGSISYEQAREVTELMHRIGCASAPRLARKLRTLRLFSRVASEAPSVPPHAANSSGGVGAQASHSSSIDRGREVKARPVRPVRLLDVAGGSGVYAAHIRQENPHVAVAVADLPTVGRARSEGRFIPEDIGRVDFDMFREDWPVGYDVHLLSNVLHDWGPTKSLDLLKKAYAALPEGGFILIHEMLLATPIKGPGHLHDDMLAALQTHSAIPPQPRGRSSEIPSDTIGALVWRPMNPDLWRRMNPDPTRQYKTPPRRQIDR